jgi:hypothetical protein
MNATTQVEQQAKKNFYVCDWLSLLSLRMFLDMPILLSETLNMNAIGPVFL